MNARVYLLLDVVPGRADQAATTLVRMPGVAAAECLEGQPGILVLMESPDRATLAERLNQALAAIENVTEDIRLLLPRDSAVPAG